MKKIQKIEVNTGNQEELLPDFMPNFPYIATCAELDKYIEPVVPWHWHRAVELFYIQSGCLEYATPGGKWTFSAGSGGFVNSNVLHSSRFHQGTERNIQLLHLFDPTFLAGEQGSLIEEKYILPLTASAHMELIPLFPDDPVQAEILELIKAAFSWHEQEWGYELKLREALTQIWLKLLKLTAPAAPLDADRTSDDNIKTLMVYIHEHYRESISVEDLAQMAHISRRSCFRLFQENLHMTPVEYIRSYRLQKACHALVNSNTSVTGIAYACGLGSSSYFGKVFREMYHCTPGEYRKRWHDNDKNRHK